MGKCECGCGGETTIAKLTKAKWGHVKGQPLRFLNGHNSLPGPLSLHWKGGRIKTSAGYIAVSAPGHPRPDRRAGRGYVLEHILVAEKALGRFLPQGVEVHHVNEKKDDNRNQNLVICENSAYHGLLHKRMKERAEANGG